MFRLSDFRMYMCVCLCAVRAVVMSARQEQLLQAQKTVEQLRTQASLERTKVSVSSKR